MGDAFDKNENRGFDDTSFDDTSFEESGFDSVPELENVEEYVGAIEAASEEIGSDEIKELEFEKIEEYTGADDDAIPVYSIKKDDIVEETEEEELEDGESMGGIKYGEDEDDDIAEDGDELEEEDEEEKEEEEDEKYYDKIEDAVRDAWNNEEEEDSNTGNGEFVESRKEKELDSIEELRIASKKLKNNVTIFSLIVLVAVIVLLCLVVKEMHKEVKDILPDTKVLNEFSTVINSLYDTNAYISLDVGDEENSMSLILNSDREFYMEDADGLVTVGKNSDMLRCYVPVENIKALNPITMAERVVEMAKADVGEVSYKDDEGKDVYEIRIKGLDDIKGIYKGMNKSYSNTELSVLFGDEKSKAESDAGEVYLRMVKKEDAVSMKMVVKTQFDKVMWSFDGYMSLSDWSLKSTDWKKGSDSKKLISELGKVQSTIEGDIEKVKVEADAKSLSDQKSEVINDVKGTETVMECSKAGMSDEEWVQYISDIEGKIGSKIELSEQEKFDYTVGDSSDIAQDELGGVDSSIQSE